MYMMELYAHQEFNTPFGYSGKHSFLMGKNDILIFLLIWILTIHRVRNFWIITKKKPGKLQTLYFKKIYCLQDSIETYPVLSS